ncbi:MULTISPECIES: GcrA family cell cycle regulator [unclassified Sphingomonas]|uniref:GcrA family cell cycle regulator n=1 Tax=unclassified Sphingomonas TaxID=196159 RepID=UPI001619EDC2|nr:MULTISPECIES: GcrA family cell cycle regulator [unclassified Sphingomonas]MBB3346956.1 GcrA cell cycle regulator [Sphingomonas sp. BK069]MBB3471793.1 GcrA cell cycle regulator [Sphingomonas sp. BK345]
MSWTDERIDTLKTMWEAGQTASQIAEALGGVSRNAVIGKAHRLGLQSRPSPVTTKEEARAAESAPAAAPVAAAPAPKPTPAPVRTAAPAPAPAARPAPPPFATDSTPEAAPAASDVDDEADEVPSAPPVKREPVLRSVGPGGFVRQAPGEQQPPIAPAPPRRLVPARTAPEFANKTSLLDLNDKICKWPLGHPGEPDFHFCGDKVNPGFPYCVEHCGHAYQAQLPRRDRRAPPLPFGGPRMR